jgi:transcriptional regulator with XRE-family HTH domain
MTVSEAISKRIQQLLKDRDMTLYRLGILSGVLHGTLNGIVNCKNKAVNLAILIKIAKGFDMEINEFLNDPVFKESNLKL